MKMKALKALNNANQSQNGFCINADEPNIDSDGLALFNPNGTYKSLFGEEKKETKQQRQRLSVVKITNGNRSIYRSYRGSSVNNLDTNSIGLSPNSWQQLLLKDIPEQEVEVKKSWWLPFCWNHPNTALRIPFIFGIISGAIAVVSILLTIILSK